MPSSVKTVVYATVHIGHHCAVTRLFNTNIWSNLFERQHFSIVKKKIQPQTTRRKTTIEAGDRLHGYKMPRSLSSRIAMAALF
jgi:hypothetical protein